MTEMSREQVERDHDTVREWLCSALTPLAPSEVLWAFDRLRDIALRSAEVAEGGTPETDALIETLRCERGVPVCDEWDRLERHARSLERRLSARSVSAGEPLGAGMEIPEQPPRNNFTGAWEQYADALRDRLAAAMAENERLREGKTVRWANAAEERMIAAETELTALRATSSKDGAVEWIPVTERLPDGQALMFHPADSRNGELMTVAILTDGTMRQLLAAQAPTHWRPLPTGPALAAAGAGEGGKLR